MQPARVPLPPTTPPTTLPVLTLPAEPPATSPAAPTTLAAPTEIVFDQLWSPEPAIAQASGTGAVAVDPVTVDGEPGDVVEFDVRADGSFDMRVFIADEGAHTVCIADTCGRVYTLAADAETPEEVIDKIDEARAIANELMPFEEWFPEWTFEIPGLLAGTGGSVDDETKTVNVYRNRGRTVDDFVRTIFHEYGHVADAEWLDDDRRAEFTALRGFAPGTLWHPDRGHRLDDWAASPAEDFAEVIAAVWAERDWAIRTDGGPLTDDDVAFVERVMSAALG
jgi:hypothetical protein